MGGPWASEIVRWYLRALEGSGGGLVAPVLLICAFFVLCWSDRAPLSPRVGKVVLALAALAGVVLAARQISVLDDANYSFRYAENWIAGKGLVFNEGERVEGYTNFLWVVMVAALAELTPFRPHWLALVVGLASFVANVIVVARIGARLDGGRTGSAWLPAAAFLLAMHTTFQRYATTGLETQFASLLVDLGLLALVSDRGVRGAAAAGAMFVLATLTRPDHALFWVAGLAALPRRDARTLGAYALPLMAVAAHLLWKLSYYGALLPNSFWARAADEEHARQGLAYGLSFLLGSHAWLLGALFLASFVVRAKTTGERAYVRFAAVAVPTWCAYVTWVGGDYNYGRFYVVILPLCALGAERGVHALRGRTAWGAAVLGGLLVASGWGLPIIPPRQTLLGIADETTSTGHTWRDLIDGDTILAARATWSFQAIVDAGIDLPVEGTGGFAYRTRLRVVEACGLMDPEVATRARDAGAQSGHEKCLDRDDLVARGVRFSFTRNVYSMGFSEDIPQVRGQRIDELCDRTTCIHVLAYDRALMRRLAGVPGLRFVDFDAWLDTYVAELGTLSPARVRADLRFFREYWFRFNEGDPRLAVLEAIGGPSAETVPNDAAPPGMSGFRERMGPGSPR